MKIDEVVKAEETKVFTYFPQTTKPSFFPAGTKDPFSTKAEGEVSRADVFNGVLTSCLKVDLAHAMEQA